MSFGGVDTVSKAGKPDALAGRDSADIIRALHGILQRDQLNRQAGFQGVPLPRPAPWADNAFGPGEPLIGEPLDQPRRDTNQPDPRLYEYPVSWNLQLGDNRHVGWGTLKKAAESPIFRACIELRKTELATMDWQIRVSPKAAAKLAQRQGKSKTAVMNELTRKYDSEIDRLTAFWEMPDRKNGRDFSEWIGLVAEEQLVWDAVALYPRMTYGGDLLDLWVIDGSTIKPLLDETGGRPAAPAVAFQQLLYGFPRGEFTAQTFMQDGKEFIPGAMRAGELIYKRRTPRSWTPYGFSATEQALLHGLLYNRRLGWMISEYTEGTMPAQFMESDGQLDWSPNQLLEYERMFNDRLSGQTAERMRAQFLPPGFRAAAMSQVGERYKPDFDLHAVKLVAMHFLTTVAELGFTETGGLGSTGFHEGQESINFRKGRLPDLKWFGDLNTQIGKTHLKAPPELEFAFLGLDDEDETAADLLDHQRLADGRMTLNQAVTKIGLPAFPFKEANMPMMQTARGVVFLEGSSEQAPPGVLIEPASEPNDVNPDGSKNAAKPGSGPAKPVTKEALDEFYAYKRWQLKPNTPARPFNFGVLEPDQFEYLAGYDGTDHCVFLAKAAGSGPKAGTGQAGSETSSWSPYSDLS